jgi:hypothetical protein
VPARAPLNINLEVTRLTPITRIKFTYVRVVTKIPGSSTRGRATLGFWARRKLLIMLLDPFVGKTTALVFVSEI